MFYGLLLVLFLLRSRFRLFAVQILEFFEFELAFLSLLVLERHSQRIDLRVGIPQVSEQALVPKPLFIPIVAALLPSRVSCFLGGQLQLQSRPQQRLVLLQVFRLIRRQRHLRKREHRLADLLLELISWLG